jgi:F-type H+-transporting ATPase subunit a
MSEFGLNIQRDILSLKSDILFDVFGFPVASSTAMTILIMILIAIFSVVVVRKFTQIPGRFQAFIEIFYEETEGLLNQITNNRSKHTQILFPIIAAMFVYLGISNLIGVIPGISEITFKGMSLFRAPTSDFSTTLGLALASVLAIQWVSIKEFGILGHLGKFFKLKEVFLGFKKSIMEGVMALIDFFVGLLDIIGEFAKIISLALRLFGNMYAGAVLMTIIFGAVAFVVPVIWVGMNIFVGVLQAMVFGALVGAYYMLAVKEEDE